MSTTFPLRNVHAWPESSSLASVRPLTWLERATLAVGIWEIPLQLDKYYFHREYDSELGAVAGLNVSVTTFALIGIYLMWWLRAAATRSRSQQPLILGFPMLVYMAFVGLSVLSASVPALTIFDSFVLLQAYALFFYLANRLQHRDDVLFCGYTLVATLLTQSVLVIGLAGLGSSAHGERYDFGPLSLSVWEGGRVAGSLVSAVVCGSVMASLWIPVMALGLTVRSRRGWYFAVLGTVAGLLAILLTQTRGAIINVVLGSVMVAGPMFLRGWLPRWTLVAGVLLSLLAAYPLAKVVQERVVGDDNGSAESRMHLSLIALEAIQDAPLFGYGAGNCHLAAQPYADQGRFRSEWYYTIHSKYLLTWLEIGMFGFISFLCLLANGVLYGVRAWFCHDRLLATLGLALAAGIGGNMVHMAVDIFNSRVQVQILFTLIGFSAAVFRLAQHPSASIGDACDVT